MVGSGHSFTDAACTDGSLVKLDRYGRVLSVDRAAAQVKVQAGITIAGLNRALAAEGLALENLGDIAYQTISGAVSTSTHGTGVKLGGIAQQIVGLELVTADGSVRTCSRAEDPDLFDAARVGVGALGILSTVTLQCVPAFNLHAVEVPMKLDHVLEHLDEYVDGNEHFEFFYVPHTRTALTKRNNRTDAPADGMSRWREWYEKVLIDNVGFGFAQRVGRRRPSWYRPIMRRLPSTGRSDYVKASYGTFASPRLVHFYEMEYSVPRAACADLLLEVKAWIDASGQQITFPIEVRFTAGDDVWLSTAQGRESCYIAVHVYRGRPYEGYFRAVESIMNQVGGRPHWGKLHFQTAETLRPRYERWDDWQSVRRRVDPEGRFANAYTKRVFGD